MLCGGCGEEITEETDSGLCSICDRKAYLHPLSYPTEVVEDARSDDKAGRGED